MVESQVHSHLKRVAVLWLLNQGCFLADVEVPLSQFGLLRYTEFDNKTTVDAVGVGLRFNAGNGRGENIEGFDPSSLIGVEAGECILRGVEVKVTRGDFRSGFACSGCNYHYLLTPMKMLAPSEVPNGIGLVEYNKHKWGCEPDYDSPNRPYKITGLRVLKHPIYREVPRFQVDGIIAHLSNRTQQQTRQRALENSYIVTARKTAAVSESPNQ
jgi:hypothetical protein